MDKQTWVQTDMGTDGHGYRRTWVQTDMGTDRHGYRQTDTST